MMRLVVFEESELAAHICNKPEIDRLKHSEAAAKLPNGKNRVSHSVRRGK